MATPESQINFRKLFDAFDHSTTSIDCGLMCSPFNPSGKPFCCDICHAVPVAYKPEWEYLAGNTDLWHHWRGDECISEPADPKDLLEQTPDHLQLLACKGPLFCLRDFRAISCRQFPFFPYITSDFRFIGLTYDWEFTDKCWVLSNLDQVNAEYRNEFIHAFDAVFSVWLEDLDSYAILSEETRDHYAILNRRFPLLHRNGKLYLISPKTEQARCVPFSQLPKFSPFSQE